jgi:hypothetical protein
MNRLLQISKDICKSNINKKSKESILEILNKIKREEKGGVSLEKVEKRKTKMELFKELGNYNTRTNQTRIVCVDEFINNYSTLELGNGGSWCRRENTGIYKIATLKSNGKINYLWNKSSIDEDLVNRDFGLCETTSLFTRIKYIKIFGIKENTEQLNRPIRKDIKEYYRKKKCCSCGSSIDLVCDHKNDLYNDDRVLKLETQNMDDFQCLCNGCNLKKREFSNKMKKTGKRIGVSDIIPSLACYNDFNIGDEKYDATDINALLGTYWYDPIEFMNKATRK